MRQASRPRRQKARYDSHINFEDIPRLTAEQLASRVRLPEHGAVEFKA